MPKKSRKELRDEKAEKVCREVRYQMVKFGGIADNQVLYNLMYSWMKVAKKNKWKRPYIYRLKFGN